MNAKYCLVQHIEACADECEMRPSDIQNADMVNVDIEIEDCYCDVHACSSLKFMGRFVCNVCEQKIKDSIAQSKISNGATPMEYETKYDYSYYLNRIKKDPNEEGRKQFYTDKPLWLKSSFTGLLKRL